MGLLPGAGGGEGVAGGADRGGVAATHRDPGLGVASSVGGEVGERAEPRPVSGEQLHGDLGTTATGYEDHTVIGLTVWGEKS